MKLHSTYLLALLLCLAAEQACHRQPYPQGQALYQTHCASCHMDDGLGLRGVIPPLANADYIARDPAAMACIIRYGLQGEVVVNAKTYNQPMEGIPQLTEFQIANIINYINSAWGNDYGYVSVPEVRQRLAACAQDGQVQPSR